MSLNLAYDILDVNWVKVLLTDYQESFVMSIIIRNLFVGKSFAIRLWDVGINIFVIEYSYLLVKLLLIEFLLII